MAFECPTCSNPTLVIVDKVELGPGDYDDERAIQRIACKCGMRGAAEYFESRRGSGESWSHDGYVLDATGLAALDEWFAASPRRAIDHVSDVAQPVSSFRMKLSNR